MGPASAAAERGRFLSGFVARIVKSWPDRSWPTGQGRGQGLPGRDSPTPSVILRQCQPTDDHGPAAITSEQETKQNPDGTVAADGLSVNVPGGKLARGGRDAAGKTGAPMEKEKRS